MPHARAVDVDQLERAAAEVADDAVGLVHAGDDAERGQFRLALAGEHVDLRADRCARRAAMKPRPFLASRQAAVAIAHTFFTPIVSQSARKRSSAASACSTASAASNPVDCTSRPSPHSAFSLKIGVGLRVRPS